DRNGTVHSYTYDPVGRQISDRITTFGGNVDKTVNRIDTAYDTAGRPYLFTSYIGSSVVNQVRQDFDDLGNLIKEYQSHHGAVNTTSTPKVQYGYTSISTGKSRLTSITYPNGRVVNFNYAAGLDDLIGRLSSMSDSSGTLEAYTYMGA